MVSSILFLSRYSAPWKKAMAAAVANAMEEKRRKEVKLGFCNVQKESSNIMIFLSLKVTHPYSKPFSIRRVSNILKVRIAYNKRCF